MSIEVVMNPAVALAALKLIVIACVIAARRGGPK